MYKNYDLHIFCLNITHRIQTEIKGPKRQKCVKKNKLIALVAVRLIAYQMCLFFICKIILNKDIPIFNTASRYWFYQSLLFR